MPFSAAARPPPVAASRGLKTPSRVQPCRPALPSVPATSHFTLCGLLQTFCFLFACRRRRLALGFNQAAWQPASVVTLRSTQRVDAAAWKPSRSRRQLFFNKTFDLKPLAGPFLHSLCARLFFSFQLHGTAFSQTPGAAHLLAPISPDSHAPRTAVATPVFAHRAPETSARGPAPLGVPGPPAASSIEGHFSPQRSLAHPGPRATACVATMAVGKPVRSTPRPLADEWAGLQRLAQHSGAVHSSGPSSSAQDTGSIQPTPYGSPETGSLGSDPDPQGQEHQHVRFPELPRTARALTCCRTGWPASSTTTRSNCPRRYVSPQNYF